MNYQKTAKKIIKASVSFGPEEDGQTLVREQFFEKQGLSPSHKASLKNFMINKGYMDARMNVTSEGHLLAESSSLPFWWKYLVLPVALLFLTIVFSRT